MDSQTNKIDFSLFKRLIKLATPYKSTFILAGVLTLLLAPLSIVRPYLIQLAVDDYILKFDQEGLLFIIGCIVGILFLEAIMNYWFIYSTNLLGQNVIRDLRVMVFKHVMRMRLTYFDRTPIGTSITRTVSDVETINTIFSEGVITIIADFLKISAVLFIMFYSSWKLALVALIPFPLLIWVSYVFKENVKSAYQIVRTQVSKMNAFLQERISGMRIVHIFNAEKDELENFKTINRKYTQANINTIFYYAIFFPVVEIISASALGLIIWYGARGVIAGGISPGMLIAFPLYINMVFRPVRMLADKFNSLQMGLIAGQRVFNLLDTKQQIPNEGSHQTDQIKGHIEFDQVFFSYNQDSPPKASELILKDLSFKVNPGETMAIVGSTGSGKTTIINVLNRFYEIHKGEVKIDGVPLKSYELLNLRKHIAVVLQDVFLFSGSVLENITLRSSEISREEVIRSSKLIGAHEFIEKLPGGYDYKVMERGATLSMGQRQLISFVRALVFNPDILILDEATSSIDPETESVIQNAIEKLIDKRTSIIIAHRLGTIKHADNILVLDKGKKVEFGPHDELLKIEDGRYRELFEMQFMEPVEEE